MRKLCIAIMLVISVSGCNLEEVYAITDNFNDKKIWVFVQINVPLKGEKFEDYFYYGKISEPLYTRIKTNRINSGFILLDDVMYWGQDDLIHEYADEENEGEIVFRIEDIKKIELVNKKPDAGRGSEQFELKKPETPEKKLK